MNRRGVDFTLVQTEPGLWKWRFKIGKTVTAGQTQTALKGLAAHRVRQRIDRALNRPRELAQAQPRWRGGFLQRGPGDRLGRVIARCFPDPAAHAKSASSP